MQELDVINAMLQAVGEQPVTTADSQHPSVLSAQVQLQASLLEVQSHGWWFNTSLNLLLTPSSTGEVRLPADTLSVRPPVGLPVVQRGGRLYNTSTASYTIGQAVRADIIQFLPLPDLPVAAAIAVRAHAVAEFYVGDDGDLDKARVYSQQYQRAMTLLRQEQLRASPVNASDSNLALRVQIRNKVLAGHGTRLNGGVDAY